jgi:aspartyl-tRNA(Asn)/glutamyl-tRNA(Gln) amidotransferase subunit A
MQADMPTTIAAARTSIQNRELSCTELAQASLDAIARLDPLVHAFITIRPAEDVLRDADDLDRRPEEDLPLRGIPIALKDVFATQGLRTTAASRILTDWVPSVDATVVRRLREAGAVLVGKVTLHEFANGPTNDNPHYGRPMNPWDRDRITGGSSGGSAAALASGMCLGSLGTDTGGSVRTPSALCGTVGLKPTFGLVSRRGVTPFSRSLDHVGPMARTVRDAAILLTTIAGHDPADPDSIEGPALDYEATLEAGVAGLRVGVETSYLTALMSTEVRRAFDGALTALTSLGAEIVELRLPVLRASLAAELCIIFPEGLSVHERTLRTRPLDYGRDVRLSFLSGHLYSALDYVRAQRVRAHIRDELDQALRNEVDLLAMPTVVIEAPPWGADRYAVDGQEFDALNTLIRCAVPFNLSGHPALSVPCSVEGPALPVGLQLVGRRCDDATVLAAGHALEQTRETRFPHMSWAQAPD